MSLLIPCSDRVHTPVPPVVRVRQTRPADYGVLTVLECSVVGFFPQAARASWLRDGAEVADRRVVHGCLGQRGLELPASLLPGADAEERGEGELQGGAQQPGEEPGGGLG